MVLRNHQLETLRAPLREQFAARADRFLCEHWPRDFAKRQETQRKAWIRAGVDDAAGYGLHDQQSTLRFLNCRCALGDEFPRRAKDEWALDILRDPALSAAEKMDLVIEEMRD